MRRERPAERRSESSWSRGIARYGVLPVKTPCTPRHRCNLCFIGCIWQRPERLCGSGPGERQASKTTEIAGAVFVLLRPPAHQLRGRWVSRRDRAGYPQYSNDSGPEVGYYNLAVFFEACNFNCLYCQNWSFKKKQLSPRWSKVATIEEAVKPDTSCICFFGGDPGPQLPFALRLSGSVRKKNPEKILRICWETNGAMNRPAKKWRVSHAVGRVCTRSTSSMETGNHRDICGWENRQVLDNSKGGRMGLRAPPTRRCCRQHAACTRYFERNEIWGWQIYRPDKPRLPLRPSRLSPRSFYG